MTNILWMVAIWWMFSRMLRAIRIIQYQKMLQDKENQINFIREEDSNTKEEIPLEMVEDVYCGKLIEKSQAYQLSRGNETLYFCSWDCREKYIKDHKQSE